MNSAVLPPCVLIVEDEMCLALTLEDILLAAGYRVLKAARLANALALVESSERIDAAILDINLGGTAVFPVADVLERSGVPLLFTSGYGVDGLPPEYHQSPMLQKPYGMERLQLALTTLMQGVEKPTGFQPG